VEIVLHIESKEYPKVKEILLKDDIVSRSSLIFKEASIIEKEGYYCYLFGTEEQCKRALELVKEKNEETGEETELAKEASEEEKKKVINKIKEEEDKAIEGFGGILS
jgi:hypothetical protein